MPFFRSLIAEGVEIEVGFFHQGSAGRAAHDPEFGIAIKWDMDFLSGYPSRVFFQGVTENRKSEQIKIAPQLIPWSVAKREVPLLLLGWSTEIMWLVWILRILLRAPTLVMSETTPLSFAATPKPPWRVSLLRWMLMKSTANLFIGSRNLEFLSKMGLADEKLFHTPYSIDSRRFSAEVDKLRTHRSRLCSEYRVNPVLPVFLFCGKLIPKKRPVQLLEAFLAAGLKDVAQLVYVGEGELRPALEERIQASELRNVRLLGFLNQSQMPIAYTIGELLCLVSDPTETWGLVVNEAAASSLPVLVSDTVGCSVDLVGEDNGWITPLDDHHRLTKALSDAFKQRGEWARMGEKGREKAAGHTFSSMARGVISALASIN